MSRARRRDIYDSVGRSWDKLAGFPSARLGTQWRVLYWIDESKRVVVVQDIQHRSNAYRRR